MTSSPFSKFIPIVSAALVLLSCSESPEKIADRVFNLAGEQVLLIDSDYKQAMEKIWDCQVSAFPSKEGPGTSGSEGENRYE